MKKIYFTLSVFLCLLILLCLYFHFSYLAPKVDSKIHARTMELIKIAKKPYKDHANNKKNNHNTSILSRNLWKNNVFDPLRGRSVQMISNKYDVEQTGMELIGICDTSNLKGAIILQNKKEFRTGRLRDKSKKRQVKEKRFFKIDECLQGGYILEEICSNSVTLRKLNRKIVLKLKTNKTKFKQ